MGPIAEVHDVRTKVPMSESCNCFDNCSVNCFFTKKITKHKGKCPENREKISLQASKIYRGETS